MAKLTGRYAQVARKGGPIELVTREVPDPKAGDVRVRVQACGICHSDTYTKDALYPGMQYPRIPGHEVAGTIDGSWQEWRDGNRSNASGSAGTAEAVAIAMRAAAETFSRARQ